jgi:cellulose synthase/poly-beta-1,6-N-acetylglucosamine synthase-like glycosyltransferase/exo-beta-1,3-glucanase (GH17 family)
LVIFAAMIQEKRKNASPTRFEHITGKLLILIGIISAIIFINWLLDPEFIGYRPLYYVLIGTFIYKIIRLFIEWALCFHLTIPEKPPITKKWKVDVLTTYCPPEPKEMVIQTLKDMVNITYPHKNYLCDESDDEELKRICGELGVIHVTRTEKKNAKAGNINNALYTVADGEICVILDPDHRPFPDFLDEVLPYFEDEQIGYVQVVQAYYNHNHTVIAKAAAQQTYQFYGPFMMGLNTLGAVPAIGANCTFRRAALDSIGGHAPGLTEDMHTSMLLHSKGWKSVYNPVIVAKGLVPWNYTGYCMQQLKWSRGSFDLFFKVIPRIFRKLTWKQLFYYCIPPFFYLSGLVSLIDFLIPIIALLSGIFPIKISFVTFIQYYIPLFVATIAIRQFNQKWLLEQHEKGSFIFGGTLLKSSWWAILLGFLYALVDKKVPYIPTPKGFEYETPLKILIPNFILIGISAFAIHYGLTRDFNPFSIFMAFLAATNITILTLGSAMAMQHVIITTHKLFKGTFISKGSPTRRWFYVQNQKLYTILQMAGLPLIIITIIAIFALRAGEKKQLDSLRSGAYTIREFFIPDVLGVKSGVKNQEANFVYKTINIDDDLFDHAVAFYDSCRHHNKMPYFIFNFTQKQLEEPITTFAPVMSDVFLYFREEYIPVFIGVTALDKKNQRNNELLAVKLNELATLANQLYFPNIAWVWESDSPYDDPNIEYNRYSLAWILTGSEKIDEKAQRLNTDIPILVMEDDFIRTLNPTGKRKGTMNLDLFNAEASEFTDAKTESETFEFDGYIYGVAYNPGHDWRDNKLNIPLTIDKLEQDFQNIKDMGANTIRRYSPSVYDRNILKVANEKDLKVMYGFWFNPKIDYSTSAFRKRTYEWMVLQTVRRMKDNPAIMGWTLGNETWGLLKLNFNEPYLSQVRMEYVKMIAELAKKVKELDPTRPVFVVEEHTSHVSSAYFAFSAFAPDVDVFGVNSYYHQNISILDSVMHSVNPHKKYFIGEFGPNGYWHHEYNHYMYDTIIYEHNSFSKAENFIYQWDNYIYNNRERNIGGIAFCWQDRYEGTATWFGITDIFGNRKPSFNALKKSFTADTMALDYPIPVFQILMPKDYLNPGENVNVIAATRDIDKRELFLYKWIVYEEGTFKRIVETPFTKGGYQFSFRTPNEWSDYRLYLYVSDNKGNVVTESSPLIINWNR